MPVNYQQIQEQIRKLGELTPAYQQELDNKLAFAVQRLKAAEGRNEELRAKVQAVAQKVSHLRCAIPSAEPLNAAVPMQPGALPGTILAADGSQIIPDPHAAVLFGVINIGIFSLQPGQGMTPQETTHTDLLYLDRLYNPAGGLINEEMISMLRDLEERRLLVQHAADAALPVVTLTDGPLELFREPASAASPDPKFNEYLDALKELANRQIITAGYVDRPRADLLVRLLELDMFGEAPGMDELRMRPLQGITDAALLGPLLPAGHRSAVFGLQSFSGQFFQNEIALHFFYLNAGTTREPWIARVEIPAWLAQDEAGLALLQRTLVAECRQLGQATYPYSLLRAHEIALVTLEDKEYLENMVSLELLKQGIPPQVKSHKQTLKNMAGTRTRLK